MFKLNEEYKVVNLIGATTVTADLNGTAQDLEVYEPDALAVVSVGNITSTTATFVVNIQGSTASAGTYTTLASSGSLTGTASAYKFATIPVSLTDSTDYKYIRAQVDTTANGGTVSAVMDVKLLVKPVVATSGINTTTFA